jgi:PAS domain S-box-containing protein
MNTVENKSGSLPGTTLPESTGGGVDGFERSTPQATPGDNQNVQLQDLLLRTLVDALPEQVHATDINGRILIANMAVTRRLGFSSPDEIIGRMDSDLFHRDAVLRSRAAEQEVIQTGQKLCVYESPLVDEAQPGKIRRVSTTKIPMKDDRGEIIGFINLGQDITERRQMEETLNRERSLLQTLIDNLPDAIYAKDTDGRKTLVNAADLKNLRRQSVAEVIGRSDFDLFPQEIAEKFFADDMRVFEGQPVINRVEYILNEAGEMRWLMTSKLPLRDPAGKIIGLVGIGRDITERKVAEDALRFSEAKLRQFTVQLERSNRDLQDFAYVASHDLQEPLRKIVVFGERLKEKCGETLDPVPRDYLERMQKAAARMQTLINDLLAFSRVTTKARPFAPVNLAEAAGEVVGDLETRIEQVNGRVEIGDLPVVESEPLLIRQLLQNLIGNALKFRRPETPPVVTLSARKFADASGREMCELTVTDNGIGFDEKYVDRIFNVFQRLHARSEYEGNGMGLAIVKKIALHHGGDITAKSRPGGGSSFILTLPVKQSNK